MRKPGVLIACIVAAVLLAGGLTATILHRRSVNEGALSTPGGSGGLTLPPREPLVSLGGLMLCVTGRSPATVTSVIPVHPTGGFTLQAWGIRPNPFRAQPAGRAIGAERRPLSSFPGFGKRVVTGKCGQMESELAVQVGQASAVTASAEALRVQYTIHGKSRSVIWPFFITLCAPSDHAGHCASVASPPPAP